MNLEADNKICILTRSADKCEAMRPSLIEMGYAPVIEPMLRIKLHSNFLPTDISSYQGIILTSSNGCPRDISDEWKAVPVYVVGEQTYQTAKKHGFQTIFNANNNAEALAELIIEKTEKKALPYLYLSAEETSFPMEERLASENIKVHRVSVYSAIPVQDFSADFKSLLEAFKTKNVSPFLITFYSKRTANNFIQLVQKNDFSSTFERTKCLCISESVLECVQDISWGNTYVLDRPDGRKMFEMMRKFINAPISK